MIMHSATPRDLMVAGLVSVVGQGIAVLAPHVEPALESAKAIVARSIQPAPDGMESAAADPSLAWAKRCVAAYRESLKGDPQFKGLPKECDAPVGANDELAGALDEHEAVGASAAAEQSEADQRRLMWEGQLDYSTGWAAATPRRDQHVEVLSAADGGRAVAPTPAEPHAATQAKPRVVTPAEPHAATPAEPHAATPAKPRVVRSLLEMRQANVVVQKYDLSCGAAALTTLLKYQHGNPVTEKEVAVSLMSRPEYIEQPDLVRMREGFSLLDLKRYTDSHAYLGTGYGKLELKDLVKMAPLMVPIKALGYNHFVIFRGMRGNRVLLADPAWGNRTMLVQDFLDVWIDFPKIGHVGFAVEQPGGVVAQGPRHLAVRADDFVMLR